MSEWALKRFWEKVSVEKAEAGYTVKLDGRNVRTPGKAPLIVPTQEMAARIAAEWEAQEERVDPTTMPWTRSSNSAIDKLSVQRDDVEAHLIGYAGTDLLSYRADAPAELAARQAEAWDPILDWVENRFNARLSTTSGVMPVVQKDEVIANLRNVMCQMSNFQVTGFHDLVTLSGSYVLATAVVEKSLIDRAAWDLSRIDEEFQIEQWGRDEEAEELAQSKRTEFLHAAEFYRTA